MLWVFVAISSAAAFASVNILEKITLTRYVPSFAAFTVVTGLFQLPWVVIIFLINPPEAYTLFEWTIAYLSGVCTGISLIALFYVVQGKEVSRVIPVYTSAPIFVAILAFFFLSEDLSVWHWMAIFCTIAGAGAISYDAKPGTDSYSLLIPFFIMVAASAVAGLGFILNKLVLDTMDFWSFLPVRNMGLATPTMLLAVRPSVFKATIQALTTRRSLRIILLNEGLMVPFAIFLTMLSVSLGPVSLVVTAQSSRPLFVFFFSSVLSFRRFGVLHERLTLSTLLIKIFSLVLIVVGVAMVSTI